jgi:hypothetical protein
MPPNVEEEESPSMFTPAGNKAALEACTRAPEGDRCTDFVQPRKLMAEDTEKADPTEDSADSIDEPRNLISTNKVVINNDRTSNAEISDNTNEVIVSTIAQEDTARRNVEDVEIAAPEPVSNLADLPGVTVREKLKSCLVALKYDHDEKIVSPRNSNLSKSHEEIRKFLSAVIKSKGRKGGRNNNHAPILYICGVPGSGKTMSTTQLCKEAIAEEIRRKEDWEEAPRYCHINCTNLQGYSKGDALDRVLGQIEMSKKRLCRSKDDSNAFAMILILDEVDTLIGSSGTEEFLRTLSGWAKDPDNILSLIGISNAINDSRTRRLLEYGMVCYTVVVRYMNQFFGTELTIDSFFH